MYTTHATKKNPKPRNPFCAPLSRSIRKRLELGLAVVDDCVLCVRGTGFGGFGFKPPSPLEPFPFACTHNQDGGLLPGTPLFFFPFPFPLGLFPFWLRGRRQGCVEGPWGLWETDRLLITLRSQIGNRCGFPSLGVLCWTRIGFPVLKLNPNPPKKIKDKKTLGRGKLMTTTSETQ